MAILNPKTFQAIVPSNLSPTGYVLKPQNTFISRFKSAREFRRWLQREGFVIQISESEWAHYESRDDLKKNDVCLFKPANAIVLITDIEFDTLYHFWLPGVGFRHTSKRTDLFMLVNPKLYEDLTALMHKVENIEPLSDEEKTESAT